jgi:hypothetical protein
VPLVEHDYNITSAPRALRLALSRETGEGIGLALVYWSGPRNPCRSTR